jgi:hypothetical protein
MAVHPEIIELEKEALLEVFGDDELAPIETISPDWPEGYKWFIVFREWMKSQTPALRGHPLVFVTRHKETNLLHLIEFLVGPEWFKPE